MSQLPPDLMRRIYGTLHPGAQRAVARAMRLPNGVAKPAGSYADGGGKYAKWWREGYAKLTALANRLRQKNLLKQLRWVMWHRNALVELKKNYKLGDAHMRVEYSEEGRRRQAINVQNIWQRPNRFQGMTTRDQIADQVLKETESAHDKIMFQFIELDVYDSAPSAHVISRTEAGRRAKDNRRRNWEQRQRRLPTGQGRQRRLDRRAAARQAAAQAEAVAPSPVAPTVVGNFPVQRYVPGQGWSSQRMGLTNAQVLARTAAANLRRR